jgi:hypothetical protein
MHLLNYFDCDTFTQNPNIFKMTTKLNRQKKRMLIEVSKKQGHRIPQKKVAMRGWCIQEGHNRRRDLGISTGR